MSSTSIFSDHQADAYPFRYAVTLEVDTLVGGTPSDPKVCEGWLRSKIEESDETIRRMVAETMVERGITAEQAAEEVSRLKHLNGFKRDEVTGELYIEGRQVKAMLKEAACIRWPDKRWGPTRKGTKSFFAEHVFVPEKRIGLGVKEPSDVTQRFVHVFRGNGIALDEIVRDAQVAFTVLTDHTFSEEEWAHLWLTGEQNGVGACRSQGYGTFVVTQWEPIGGTTRRRRTAAAKSTE